MLLQPLRNNASRQQVASSRSLPAPLGGWNARDALADMKPTDAVISDNYFPDSASCNLRGGTERYVTITGVTDAPETLMVYANGTANKMLACASGAIYDASVSGIVSATLDTGLTNDRFSYDHMGGYIVFVNGADTPRKYDGTTVSTTTITGSGLTATNLSYVCEFKSRLFFIEKDTLSAWYLTTNAIAGAASELDFTGYCTQGGKLIAIGKWTRDGGSGSDDFVAFITDKGEVLIYQGTDPASADTWALVGVFRIGAPIGNRPILNNGADLIVMTEDGYVPLSKVLPVDRVGAERLALSDKIGPAVNAANRRYGSNFGWEAVLYPKGHFALFNVPTREGSTAEQHVVNTITGAWCRFKNINAVCWALFNKQLYFGAPGGFVVLADTTDYKDDTLASVQAFAVIQGDLMPAYNYFGAGDQQKQFTMARPVINSNGNPIFSVALNVDFERRTPSQVDSAALSGTPWGSPWGSPWSGAMKIIKNWITVSGIGYCGALHIRTRTSGISIAVNSIDYAFKRGGVL